MEQVLKTSDGIPVVALDKVSISFGGVLALDSVSFEVYSNEVVALVGDNGAGKSTAVKVIAGNLQPNSGTMKVNGEAVTVSGPQRAVELGIATVYQDLALCDNLDAVKNLFLGNEIARKFPNRLQRATMEKHALEIFAQINVKPKSLTLPVNRLSGGQRQAVAISRVLLKNPGIVLMDEPTAALGVAQRVQVVELIERLRHQGKGVILISHDLEDVRRLADRVVVLRLGRVAARFKRHHYSTGDLIAAITGVTSQEPEAGK